MHTPLRHLVAVASMVTLGLGIAPSASASIAEIAFSPGGEDFFGEYPPSERLVVRGEGEEANVLSVVDEDADALVITDKGAGLRPGRGCTTIGPSRVRCTFTIVRRRAFSVEGGGGDDEIDLSAYMPPRPDPPDPSMSPDSVTGGPGADTIRMPPNGGYANGGPGPDRLIGGMGSDEFTDSDPAEPDEFDGGGGANKLNYYTRTDPITVDLAARVGGATNERDSIAGINAISGGDGPDLLLGSDAADSLNGGEGNDQLDGRAGNDQLEGGVAPAGTHDTLIGGPGDDVLRAAPSGRATLLGGVGDDMLNGGSGADEAFGGPGADFIVNGIGRDLVDAGPGNDLVAPSGYRARISCRAGRDVVRGYHNLLRPAPDCELMEVNRGLTVTRRVRIRGRHAVVRLYCERPAGRPGCRGIVRLRRGTEPRPRRVGSARFRIGLGTSRLLRISLARGTLRTYRKRGRVTLYPLIFWVRRDSSGRFTNQVGWIVESSRSAAARARH